MTQAPKQDMARKARVRAARNKSGTNTDYQAAVKRGDENAGAKSKSNQTAKAKRAHEKSTGKKVPKGKDLGHKRSLKSGGGNSSSNTHVENRSTNRSKGGKAGNTAGKAAGGRKSRRV